MSEGKAKFIEDAARIIDGRVEDLKEELERENKRDPQASHLASDRAAIAEAEHLARMIRTLALAPYHRHPYLVAMERWKKGQGS